MKRIKITEAWAKKHYPCYEAERDFFSRWPDGLTLTRQNLYMAAEALPMSYIHWLSRVLLAPRRSADALKEYLALKPLAFGPSDGYVISAAKKHAYAVALAETLGLPKRAALAGAREQDTA